METAFFYYAAGVLLYFLINFGFALKFILCDIMIVGGNI